jgi:hypothetical protein
MQEEHGPAAVRTQDGMGFQRSRAIAWYRNPDRPNQDSLGIVYEDDNDKKIVRPDFLFFGSLDDGTIFVDIVDPHGHHLRSSAAAFFRSCYPIQKPRSPACYLTGITGEFGKGLVSFDAAPFC